MTEQFLLCQQRFKVTIKMTGFYLDFNPQCAVEVIKEEHHEVGITISSYGKRYLFLEGAAEHLIT